MKIQYLSDLHLEFGPLTLPDPGAEVLVIAGDLVNKAAALPWRFFGLLVSDETSPDLRIQGHSHWTFDYQVGKTRIVGNARGYDGRENVPGFDPAKVVEL